MGNFASDDDPAARVVRDKNGRFISTTLGRPKGRGSLASALMSDLLADWIEHGRDALERVRKRRPDRYLQIILTMIPKNVNVKVREFDDVSDDQLRRQLAILVAELADGSAHSVAGTRAPEASEQTLDLPAISKAERIP